MEDILSKGWAAGFDLGPGAAWEFQRQASSNGSHANRTTSGNFMAVNSCSRESRVDRCLINPGIIIKPDEFAIFISSGAKRPRSIRGNHLRPVTVRNRRLTNLPA